MNWKLATEDELSEAVGLRLLEELQVDSTQVRTFRQGGFGYLKKQMENWINLSIRSNLLLITDLDQEVCASGLIEKWRGRSELPKGFLFRVAVREVESWLLADHEAIEKLIGKKGKVPKEPDQLQDPKQKLLELAQRASRDVRDDMVKANQPNLRQALGYNARLCPWVQREWSPIRASERSPSLSRALRRMSELNLK